MQFNLVVTWLLRKNTIICLESGVIAIWKTQCELVKNLVRFMLWNACARAACGVSHFVEFSGFSDIVKICAQHRENKVLPFFEVSI